MKRRTEMTVTASGMLAEGICSITLQYPEENRQESVVPGQFAGLYTGDSAMLLPRPISICQWNKDTGELRFVFRIAGGGTKELARKVPGQKVNMLGILGNGYPMERLYGKRVFLLGGGIGIPPLLEAAAALEGKADVTAVLGYRDSSLFLADEFGSFARVLVATEDGSCGIKGNVLDVLSGAPCSAEVICACGPLPMLRAVKKFASGLGIPAYLSLEERMACGVGVCLGCVTKTTHVDAHSHVYNARICTEGPVFDAGEVDLE